MGLSGGGDDESAAPGRSERDAVVDHDAKHE
jgi:hypothetical protein